ncbi:isochorismatase family cysteine hydrolase [Rhodocytophaga aerolata]|uniref:Isochorismatase family cysteine hydrolase n=1 Tax=Rhodocytophaga aerolata TaxID=455078 RepID=A0ABT8R0A0_9BACT|nr:isochorismatase family cysteine hydrolase [Rhodocytophaga aerolata]MDO1445516.1 isochorismatase family cysteine hydrolase [Rhodocytophaga aerolata]
MATPVKNQDLHGNVPDSSPAVLLLIDLINDFEFVDGDDIYNNLLPQVEVIVNLKKKAKKAGIPVIYVNDNFGKWQSDFRKLLDHCLKEGVKGKKIVEKLQPDEEDYFVLKPKHSAFYSTTLDVLLDYLKAKTLIMAGITGNICVLFTANDAFMRDFSLVIPSDCVASESKEENTYALEQMRKLLKADTRPSTEIDFKQFKPVKKQ